MSNESLTHKISEDEVKTTLDIMLAQLRSSKWDGVVTKEQDARLTASLYYWGNYMDVSRYEKKYENIMGEQHMSEMLVGDCDYCKMVSYYYDSLKTCELEDEED